jgi:ParB-like chromosome segregation protein Spo0J
MSVEVGKEIIVDIDRLKVNPLYESLVSKHSPEDYEAIKKDIREHGQQQPIEVNKDLVILDGHTRRKILKELGYKEAKVIVKEFKNKNEEFWYVTTSNVIRRQMNTWQKITSLLRTIELAFKSQGIKTPLKDYLQKRGRKGNSEVTSEFRTKSIADQLGLSERTVEQALYIYFNGTQELHKRLDRGEISIYETYKKLKQQGKQQPIQPHKQKHKTDKVILSKHIIITCPHCGKPFALRETL